RPRPRVPAGAPGAAQRAAVRLLAPPPGLPARRPHRRRAGGAPLVVGPRARALVARPRPRPARPGDHALGAVRQPRPGRVQRRRAARAAAPARDGRRDLVGSDALAAAHAHRAGPQARDLSVARPFPAGTGWEPAENSREIASRSGRSPVLRSVSSAATRPRTPLTTRPEGQRLVPRHQSSR